MERLARAALVLVTLALARQVVRFRPAKQPTPSHESAASDQPLASGLLFGGRLDLNRATADDLAALPGIGPARARRIVEARDARHGFDAVDDLDGVPGIGPVTMRRLRDLVQVGPAPAPP